MSSHFRINAARSCVSRRKRSGSAGRSGSREGGEGGGGGPAGISVSGARADPERGHASRYETIAQIRGTFSWKLNGGYRLPRASCGNGQYTPPTSNSLGRSRARATVLGSRSYRPRHGRAVVPHVRSPCRSLDTHLLRLIIVIYAPTTNAISLIRSSWLDPTARAIWKS